MTLLIYYYYDNVFIGYDWDNNKWIKTTLDNVKLNQSHNNAKVLNVKKIC